MDISNLRRDYSKEKLDKASVNTNPIKQFDKWLKEAISNNIADATAMNLATADKNGIVSSRIVLLKEYSEKGFIFFTNFESQKGNQLKENPNAALSFFWPILERQIRIEGKVRKIADNESDTYFHKRPLESQISAIISPQSTILSDKNNLKESRNKLKSINKKLERPNYWGGYLLKPTRIEFWQGGENRIHDRINFVLTKNNWEIHRLAP
jgi:pyridoxamine 5'-phosphate oxidase